MSWIKNGITILFSTFIALFCAEILLRILDIGYGNAPLENSTKYHHVHPSNYNFLMHEKDYLEIGLIFPCRHKFEQ